MGNNINLDSEKLEKFAYQLREFNENLKDDTKKLLSHLRELGESWTDSEYNKFADELERNAYEHLRKYDEYENHISKIKDIAQRARDFYK